MSDYFFYDLNKKMADLADKQQLREGSVPAPAPKSKLTEAAADYSAKKAAAGKDIGKPGKNFSKIAAGAAKKYGSAEAGKRVAGAVLNKLRHPTEESVDESAFQAAIGKKKYGDQGMKALQKAGRNHASDSTMNKIRNQYDKYDESVTDEGNAFSKAVVDAKRDGIQPGEKIQVGGKQYPVREQGVAEGSDDLIRSAVLSVLQDIYNGAQAGEDMIDTVADELGDYFQDVKRSKDKTLRKAYQFMRREGAEAEDDPEMMAQVANKAINMLSQQGVAEGMGANKTHLAMAYLKAVVMAPMGTPEKRRILNWQEILSDQFDIEMDTAVLAQMLPQLDSRLKSGQLDKLQNRMARRGELEIGEAQQVMAPMNPDGATAPPLKGKDGQYPIVTSGPNKGKRWSPSTPGPTNPAMKEGGMPMTPKQQKFAKLAPPVDKITFADKIVGAKNEVDEMLGDVAANAMKKAIQSRTRDMEEGSMDDDPFSRKSSTGGRIDTTRPGVTRHHAGKSYSGAGHDVGADDAPRSGQAGRRTVGAGMGKKIGAKINTGKSKLMTREGDMDPEDQGEYDQEGSMAKDSIQTVVRHAMALEKILGDNDNLPEWVQSKLAKIESMMTAVDDYMQNQQDDEMKMDEESTNKRDNRAERAGRRVAKDIEYDEKKKDGIHGQRRGSEDNKAERAGRKVTKDIEYDEKKDKPNSSGKARKKSVEEESTDTRDSHAEKAGKKVAKDIEYDEKEKDGIHGQRRGSEDNKAERAGRKVTKDIEYDEKKDKKKEVDETTSSGSVATGGAAAPKSGGGVSYGKGIYDSLNREVEKMIAESMSINMSMNNDSHGGPAHTLTVTATDEDAMQLAMLLKSAGIGSQDHGGDIHSITDTDSEMDAIHDMDHDHGDEPCPACGSSDCECDEMNEAYGDTDATDNEPDYPTDEVGTDNAMMYSGGLNGPKSTGQATIPVIGGQDDRMGYEGDHELRRMMEIAGISR
jgi:hypothetical protein